MKAAAVVLLVGLVILLAACDDLLGAEEDNGNDEDTRSTEPIDDTEAGDTETDDTETDETEADDTETDDTEADDTDLERTLTLSGTIAGSVEYDEANDEFEGLDTTLNANGMEIKVYHVPDDVQLGDPVSLESNTFSVEITVPDDWSQSFADFLDGYGISESDMTDLDFGDADLGSILVMQAVLDLVPTSEEEWLLVDGTVEGSTVTFYDHWWVDQEITISGSIGTTYTFGGVGVTLSPGWNQVPTVWDVVEDSYARSGTENTIDGNQWTAVEDVDLEDDAD